VGNPENSKKPALVISGGSWLKKYSAEAFRERCYIFEGKCKIRGRSSRLLDWIRGIQTRLPNSIVSGRKEWKGRERKSR